MKYRILTIFSLFVFTVLSAQLEKVEHKPNPSGMVDFGDLGAGPYERLVIRNVLVIPGHGGPATGPYDILVTGNVIADMNHDVYLSVFHGCEIVIYHVAGGAEKALEVVLAGHNCDC